MTKPAGVVLMQVPVFPGSWLDMTGWVDPSKVEKKHIQPLYPPEIQPFADSSKASIEWGIFFLWSEINDSDCPTRLSFTYGYGESAGWCELYRWFFIDPFDLRMTQSDIWNMKKKTMESCTRVYVDDSHGWGYTPTNIKMAPPHCADWTPNIEKKRLNQQRRASLRWPYPNLMSKHRRGC